MRKTTYSRPNRTKTPKMVTADFCAQPLLVRVFGSRDAHGEALRIAGDTRFIAIRRSPLSRRIMNHPSHLIAFSVPVLLE